MSIGTKDDSELVTLLRKIQYYTRPREPYTAWKRDMIHERATEALKIVRELEAQGGTQTISGFSEQNDG